MRSRRTRSRKRHWGNPLRYVPPEWEASTKLTGRIVGLLAAIITPSAVVANHQQQKTEAVEGKLDSTETKLTYSNANTNAVLGILAEMTERMDRQELMIARLEREARLTAPVGPPYPHWERR